MHGRYLVLLICGLFAKAACAGALWQNTTSGMSVADVAKLYPDIAPDDVMGHQALRKGGAVTIFDVPFHVLFVFDNSKLYQVRLQAADPGNNSVMKNPEVTFMQVADELVNR